jgi:hypothetical protein
VTEEAKKVQITRSNFAEKFLYLNGQPFSLEDYPHMRQIYDTPSRNVCLMFSRQTAKSTSLANMMVANSAMINYFKTLYIAPTVDQTKVFSHDRVNPVIESSPILKQYYVNTSLVQNVFMKQFLNGSRMYLRYALLSADRIRGYSADMNLFDEVQDLREDVIPIIQETMSRSEFKMSWYCGTPKRTRGTLANLWRRSSQCEYMPKCQGCNEYNLLNEDNIGNTGLICKKCGRDLDVKTGQWVSHSPDKEAEMEGYRVCLLHFPDSPWVDWNKDVILKRENTSRGIFYNETLGLEYDEGVTPIAESDMIACCDPDFEMLDKPDQLTSGYHSIIGIDYGPVNSDKSHTVVVVVQYRSGSGYRVVYLRKFQGKEADFAHIHSEVPKLFKTWNATTIAADYGMGEAANSEIRSRIGYEKVIAFQHLQTQKEKVRWNTKMPAYTLARSQVLDDLFSMIKKREIKFPRWDEMRHFADDFLNVQIEYDEDRNTAKYINIGPDDAVHALCFALVSLRLQEGVGNL